MLHAVLVGCLIAQQHLVRDEARSEAILSEYVAGQTPSQNKIRDRILRLTPMGSTPHQVLKAIHDQLHKSGSSYEKDYFTSPPSHVLGGNEQPDFYVAGSIGVRYAEQSSLIWLTGTDTDVVWYFTPDDHLVNVVVQDWNTGP